MEPGPDRGFRNRLCRFATSFTVPESRGALARHIPRGRAVAPLGKDHSLVDERGSFGIERPR